jgi:hypothetical protein
MGKRTKWLVIGLVLAAIMAIGIGSIAASAAGPTANSNTQTCGGAGGGFRFGGAVVDEAVTTLLGMTEDEIQASRQKGQSLVQIAATKDVTEVQLVDAIMAYKTTEVKSRVTAGTLTQEQADLMLQNMEQATTQAVNRTSTGPLGGQGMGQRGNGNGTGSCGGMRDNGTCTGTGAGQGKMNRLAR